MDFVFAQAEVPVSLPGIMQIAGPLGVGAILAWFMWYTVSVVLPQKDKDFIIAMKEKDQKHEEVVNKIVDEFRNDNKEQRLAEAERIKISAELARSGHAGINLLVQSINKLEMAMTNSKQ